MSMLLSPLVCFLTAASWADDELRQWGMMVALVAFSAIWITALGASVGSFLNVVVWRLPNGMSLIRPKSHCPKCGTPILPRDNVPVIGWLQLRGRCRACGEPISARYPLVEATTAMLFLGLAHFELFGGGANLPGGPPMPEGLTAVLWHVRPEMIGVFVYHATLMSLLLSISLIVWDGFRPPRSLWGLGIAIALLVPIMLPIAHPVKSGLPIGSLPQWHLAVGRVVVPVVPRELLNGALGWITGATLGAILSLAVPTETRSAPDRTGTIAVGSVVGAFMGWQAVIACSLATSVLALLNAIVARLAWRHLPVTGLFSVIGVACLLLWRPLTSVQLLPAATGWRVLRRLGWPAPHFPLSSLAAAVAAVALFAILSWLLRGRRSSAASEPVETADDAGSPAHR